MKQTARVARTAFDLQHVNKIRVPEFALVSLNLGIGGKTSKCHGPEDAPPPAAGGSDSDDFHFVPEKETIEIRYEIDDRFAFVSGATLELFTRFEEKALWTLDLAKLGADWWAHGKHVVTWDGRVVIPTAAQKGTAKGGGLEHDLTAIAPDKSLDPFPDGYVTLEHTSYKMKLTLKGSNAEIKGKPGFCWTYYHILVKSIEIELGPEEAIPAVTVDDDEHKRNKAVRKQIETDGGVPAPAPAPPAPAPAPPAPAPAPPAPAPAPPAPAPAAPAPAAKPRKVILLSNVFKTALVQMDNDSGFKAYKGLWGEGPQIPLIAKIRLADSQDAEVKLESDKGAVALGKVQFLWNWEDPDEDVNGQQSAAKPKGFINDAINYYKDGTDATRSAKDHTYPKGDNCHVDRGGKRGPDAKPVFPEAAGYDPKDTLDAGKFPFEVKGATKRKWAALSRGWTTGKLKGQTGAVFQPSRMAGDDYIISVYLAYEKSKKDELVLDAVTEPLVAPTAIKRAKGKFQVWREVHLSRYIRKKATAALGSFFPANAAGVAANFARAYMTLADKINADNNYVLSDHRLSDGTAPDYNNLLRARLVGDVVFTSNLATDPAADHASVDSMVLVRSYSQFVTEVHKMLNPAVPTAANDFAAAGVTERLVGATNMAGWPADAVTARLQATQGWLVAESCSTAADYCWHLDGLFFAIGEPFAGDLKCASGKKDGVADPTPPGIITLHFNYTNTSTRDEIAAGVGLRYWYGGAMDPSDADDKHSVIMFWKAGVDEFTHEAGHHLFLPHAKYPVADPPGGFRVERHDDTDDGCFMTYEDPRPAFCGLCQLRLRGWDNVLPDAAGKTWDGDNRLNKDTAKNKKP
jgi:hypothetical protein